MEQINFVQTLTTSAAALSPGNRVVSPSCTLVYVQPDVANSSPCYVGGSGVTTTNGIRLEGADSESRPSAPFPMPMPKGHPIALDSIYVVGAAGEKVRVWAITE